MTTDQPDRWGMRDGKGPVHEDEPGRGWGHAWCGVERQFRHVYRNDEDVTCARCLKAKARGRGFARGSR